MLLQLFIFVLLCLSIGYALFLAWIVYHWKAAKQSDTPFAVLSEQPTISIIIPARNEAESIGACLRAVLSQNYPADRFEIIVIDDHSTDTTKTLATTLTCDRLQVLAGRQPGKKAALQQGIAHAEGELIVTTDADTIAPPDWLQQLATAYQAGARMILAPVHMTGPDTLLTAWQGLDVSGTMLLTGATVQTKHPLLANGANLAFAKTYFQALDGYEGNTHRASGDDIFLLQKAVRDDPRHIAFLPRRAATVATTAEASWAALFRQRLRWAGKTGSYRDPRLIGFQALVYALSWGLCISIIILTYDPAVWPAIAAAWLLKLLSEYGYLRYATRELGRAEWLKWLLLVQLSHPVYIVLIGTLALLPLSVKWKNRRID